MLVHDKNTIGLSYLFRCETLHNNDILIKAKSPVYMLASKLKAMSKMFFIFCFFLYLYFRICLTCNWPAITA